MYKQSQNWSGVQYPLKDHTKSVWSNFIQYCSVDSARVPRKRDVISPFLKKTRQAIDIFYHQTPLLHMGKFQESTNISVSYTYPVLLSYWLGVGLHFEVIASYESKCQYLDSSAGICLLIYKSKAKLASSEKLPHTFHIDK